jgi:hypothetical protein
MTPKLNDELSETLRRQGAPLEVQDAQGQRVYMIVEKQDYRHLVDHEFQQWLQVGLDQADRGDVAPWNTAEILAEARRRYVSEQPS